MSQVDILIFPADMPDADRVAAKRNIQRSIAIEAIAQKLWQLRMDRWEKVRPEAAPPLGDWLTWDKEIETFKDHLREEAGVVFDLANELRDAEVMRANPPRTPAETEAMLNHMADVHLTPTAEKGK